MDMVVQRLNWFWRLFATAFSFATFAVGGLLLTFVWFPLVNLLISDQKRKQSIAQATIRMSFKLFVTLMVVLRVIELRVEGVGILQAEKGSIIVANHPTLIDYVLIASLLPKCCCIVKRSMWDDPFARGAISAAGYIPNIDVLNIIPSCQMVLDEGNVLLIFPEGTRTVPGQPITLKRGAANIAVRTQSDLRIVHIHCNPTTLTKGEKWYEIPATKPKILVQVREKVNISQFVIGESSDAIVARHLTEYLLEKLIPEKI